ncbi:ABC transporter substrate-binding protein [Microbacterium xanthum]|uniref:ABC transporter substrate-binding protein n=1 Tax=Microbacterium xanthum TaxID=3079794 RepID=UPI002AD2FB5A|nr:ABC transporter substrate-binding protein [Microbacterium sp. KSW-48]MDZ8172216.1 ABC transporter substrate-binding protein [Microbacterium sp. KSW-48]
MSLPTPLRRASFGALGLVGVLAFAACSTDAEPASVETEATVVEETVYPVTIVNCGADLTIDAEPESVLTIGTSAVALVDAAGASDRIVARAGEFGADLPAGLSNPPEDVEIVDPSDPAIEAIVGTEADIIVGYGLFNASDDDVAAAGIPNVVIDGECSHDAALTDKTDFEAIFADVQRLGTVFDTSETAEANVAAMRAEVDALSDVDTSQNEGESAAVVYYFFDGATMSARGGQGIADDVLARAGFENVYGDEPSVYLEANIETLLDADPHTIVLAYGLYGESFDEALALFLAEPGAENLTAVEEDRVIGVLASDLAPDPGAVRGLEQVLVGTGAIEG